MKRCKSKNEYMPQCGCMSSPEYMPSREPMPKNCMKRCVGTYTTQHRVYENCSFDICKVCACCGHEYDDSQYAECPMCGAPAETMSMDNPPMDDPPHFGGFGGFGRFGDFGERRFNDFDESRFSEFGFSPFFLFLPFRRFRRRRF